MATAKKSTSTASKPAVKRTVAKQPAHPPWAEMIKECIVANPDDARTGVSRPQIKKYVEENYKLDMGNAQLTQLSKAIASGSEKGMFVLPKGPSGRVKLPPKNANKADTSDSKENKPAARLATKVSKPTAAKRAVSKSTKTAKSTTRPTKPAAAVKKTPTAKPATVKKPTAKSSTTKVAPTKAKSTVARAATTKKPAPKKTTKQPAAKAKTTTSKKTTVSSRRDSAKKSVTGSKPAAKAKPAAKSKTIKAPAKKVAAKPASTASTRRKSTSSKK